MDLNDNAQTNVTRNRAVNYYAQSKKINARAIEKCISLINNWWIARVSIGIVVSISHSSVCPEFRSL